MEDDLEYYITFPTPVSRDERKNTGENGSGEEDEFVYVNGKNVVKEPVVFVLGWMGANDRNLSKYSDIYNNKGCITIRYTLPASHLFWQPRQRIPPVARKLLTLLADMSLDSHPVFFHVMSNNGATLYYYMTQCLHDPEIPSLQLKGCIMDSCPGPRRLLTVLRAVYSATVGSALLKSATSFCMGVFIVGQHVISMFRRLVTGHRTPEIPWVLIEDPRRIPLLMIYSHGDKMIRHWDVDRFISERRRLGVSVSTKMWIESLHVAHYRCYPEEYKEAVYIFLNKCMSGNLDVLEVTKDSTEEAKAKSE